MQEQTNLEWLLEGFKYDLELTVRPNTVKYYCGETQRFLQWAQATCSISDILLITKKHIQAFFHHLATNNQPNGLENEPAAIEHLRWPYYRSLRRFFEWAINEGYLHSNPMEGILINAPSSAPIEPCRPEHIDLILKVLDYDWQVAGTQRQKMLAARNRAIFLLFLESGLRLEELAKLKIEDVGGQKVIVRFGKMGKSRLSGFGPQSKKALWKYMGLRSQLTNNGALWVTEEGSQHGVVVVYIYQTEYHLSDCGCCHR